MNGMERLREYADATRWGGECRILHAHHGDFARECSDRECGECRAAYLRAIAEEIERDRADSPKVLDAAGVEIYKGRIAYGTRGRKYRVTELCEYEPSIVHAQAIDDGELGDEFIAANTGLNSYQLDASKLTHERPDSWERLEDDADRTASLFDAFDADASADIRNIVRRARALAERGQ